MLCAWITWSCVLDVSGPNSWQDRSTSSSTLSHLPPNFYGSFELIVSDPQTFMEASAVKKIMAAVLETLWGLEVILSFETGIGRRLQGGVRVQYYSPEQVGQLKLAQLETQIAQPSCLDFGARSCDDSENLA